MIKTSFVWWQIVLSLLTHFVGSSSAEKTTKLQHFPLIPHHAQQARRRRELLVAESDDLSLPVYHENHRRARGAVQVGALYQGYGTHYVDLWVGTPSAQRQTLIVDTGSGMTAFPCSKCDADTCGDGFHIDVVFDERKSLSYKKAKSCKECTSHRAHCSHGGRECKVSMKYAEGSSWSAFEGRDTVYLGGPHDHGLTADNEGSSDLDPAHALAFSFPLMFGCQTEITGLFKTQAADGIMGMDDVGTSFWSQMLDADIISEKKFSLCFARQPIADKEGTEAGAMTMGGYDERLHTYGPMVFATRFESRRPGFYTVHVRKIYLRRGSSGEAFSASDPKAQLVILNVSEENLNHRDVIVDSGTTDTSFTRLVAKEFKNTFEELSGIMYSNKQGVTLTEAELSALPTILIQLVGEDAMNKEVIEGATPNRAPCLTGADLDPEHPYDVLLAIPPSHYMEYDPSTEKYYNQFYADSLTGSVLGANAMMGHDVHFDIDNKRIGWAESDCDYHELIVSNGFVDSLVEGGSTSLKPEAPTGSNSMYYPNSATKDNTCNDNICRLGTAAAVFGFLAFGVAVGQICRRPSSASARYHDVATDAEIISGDLELSSSSSSASHGSIDDDCAPQYRDNPDDTMDDVAPEGTGYEDEPTNSQTELA